MNQKEIIYLSVCVLVIYYLCRTRTESKYTGWYDYEMGFRTKHCENGILVDKEDVAVLYPYLNFDSDNCNNPCDENCGFSIFNTSDQIGIETQMRPQSSNTIPVNPNQSADYAKPIATSSAKEGYCSF